MVLPETQFNCKKIQGVKCTKIRIRKEINHKKVCSQNFTETSFYKFRGNIYTMTKVVKNNLITRLNPRIKILKSR